MHSGAMFLLHDAESAEKTAAPAVVFSASDLVVAASCEYAVLQRLDVKLGRSAALPNDADPLLERTATLGDAHEARVLAQFRQRFGTATSGHGVVEIPPAWTSSRTSLRRAHDATLEALRGEADVVYQGSFFDGEFHGRADFLVREPTGRYAVYDTKLARHAKITALLQLAAYADQLERAGIVPAPDVHLILGDQSVSSHRTQDLLPLYRERRRRLATLIKRRLSESGSAHWDDGSASVCGRCDACVGQIAARRDVLLVAGLRMSQRSALSEVGVTTVDELASRSGPVDGIGARTLDSLRAQAVLQLQGDPKAGPGAVHDQGAVKPAFDVFDPAALGALPQPDPGDIFFDFEGDPLWADGSLHDWGLEYLFGVVEGGEPDKPPYVAFWAHDRDAERLALRDFLDYLAARRRKHPHLHVYHYAAYEKSALLRLSARHAEGELEVDDLLRDGVLVDLYPIVRSSLRISEASYSLKKIEPLYMGDDLRSGDVATAGDSMVEYALACSLRDAGDDAGRQTRLDAIADYNAYDCLSTLRLRDWLLERAAEHGVRPAPAREPDANGPELSEADALEAMLYARLTVASGPHDPAARSADQQAIALVGAALGYHRREDKPAWWSHFDRLNSPLDEWAEVRNTLRPSRVEALTPWHYPTPKARSLRRTIRMYAALEEGSELRPGAGVYTIYDAPVPDAAQTPVHGLRGWIKNATILDVSPAGEASPWVDVVEATPQHEEGWPALPVAVGPGGPLPTQLQRAALMRLGTAVATALEFPGPVIWPSNPALDLCRRTPPRLGGGGSLPTREPGEDDGALVTRAVRRLDRSYLAVQGPPGTGKTYVGGHVIAELVAEGWRIGVVAQSHAVVENLLHAAHRGSGGRAGVPADSIGKKIRSDRDTGGRPAQLTPTDRYPWHWLDKNPEFTRFVARQRSGWVIGGTAWDFANPARFGDTSLDLLVIDEAGQFSLANTLAVAAPARRLLLLGDPQQLPQVSQGVHPEPVDVSALAWLAEGHDTLPTDRGYFLERTWRMHPELTKRVSRLAYEDRLHAVPEAAQRALEGLPPGVRTIMVDHDGRSVASPEEAAVVLDLVRDLVGRAWTPSATELARPLAPEDLLVVAAYNAQVGLITRVLEQAGFSGVAVGTVDKFQGREAVMVIVSMAASSAEEVPRGAAFLLSRNRINVAISRGKWGAVIVRSPRLTAHVPTRPSELSELGAFVGVCEN